jgi:transcriptional regulator with XRE-family HTH domain
MKCMSKTQYMDTIGKRISTRRNALGIKQVDLARNIGIKQGYLSEIENDKKGDMGAPILMGLCRELKLTPEFLFYGEGASEARERQLLESEVLFFLRAISADQRTVIIGMLRGAFAQLSGDQRPIGSVGITDAKSDGKRPH